MMDTIKLVVFDMAGTTVRDRGDVNRCLRDALSAVGLEVTPAAVDAVMGLPKPEAIRLLINESALRDRLRDRVDTIHRDFVARSVRFYESDPSVAEVPGASRVFAVLKGSGIRVALDTGFSRTITDTILARLGWRLSPLIDATVSSDEVARGRPYGDMIIELVHRLQIASPAHVAKVGDTPSDLLEGHDAGCGLVVGVVGGTHTREQLEPYPHTHLIETIADFPALLAL
jgi:phosphonatase-like hydrolase